MSPAETDNNDVSKYTNLQNSLLHLYWNVDKDSSKRKAINLHLLTSITWKGSQLSIHLILQHAAMGALLNTRDKLRSKDNRDALSAKCLS